MLLKGVVGASRRIGEQLGIVPGSLRNWVQQAHIDAGDLPGFTTDVRARLLQLERENRKLRRPTRTSRAQPIVATPRA